MHGHHSPKYFIHQLVTNKKDMAAMALHAVTGYDLQEQENILSQAFSSANVDSQLSMSKRIDQIENTIQTKVQRDQKPEPKLLPQRARFSSSPSHNASRFCKRPKDRAVSEGDSPYHMINGSSCHRIELPCQVSVTSLNANIGLPMDRLSNKLFNSTERSHTSLGVISPRRSQNGSSCFRCRGRTPRQYVIHPDWVSESLSIGKAQLTDRGGEDFIDYTKRSQSCPPPIRNVITWDNNYTESNKKVKGTKGFE